MTPKAKVYEEVLKDYRRLTREMDEALSGPGKAAKQASLCDLITPVRKLREERDALRGFLEHAMEMITPTDECAECDEIRKYLERS